MPTISRNNEKRVWQAIKGMAAQGLARYPNTIEEDREILTRTDLTFNERNCTLFRLGEKEILVFLLEFSEFVLKLLGMKFKDAKKHTQSLPTHMNSCRDYLQNQCIPLLAKDNNIS